ncbi:DUF2796 domain-containing protein [Thiothrix lacustris]|uniref:DUF2796 domain-containing protein n=1 Tax=Thiothrix lacustris TaxID=525917 RepID=A0ABY9MXB1_9GAMM|nr:DUF2796 domain-containing protein [Thiothrix lacustris]WML92405.1 DUF2796 domain-containing protein [Thiothrix lacustris]
MKFPSTLISTLSLLLALSSSPLHADEHAIHEEHGVHEHGAATLSLAVGEAGVDIMLESPAANIVGFEHAATTDEDKQTLADAQKKLEAGADLFAFNTEAGCTLNSTEVVSALLGNTNTEKHDDHSDMDVAWAFTCTAPAALTEVTTKLFAAFPDGFEHLKVEWVTDKSASAVALEKDDTIKLTP